MLYDSEKDEFQIALTGDSMLSRPLSIFREERYLALVNILKSADAVFTNLETTVRTWDEGTPSITQGTFMTTEPRLLHDLKWMGINMVSCANNHAFDYGEGGIMSTVKHLDEAGLIHAGTGMNLAESRAPGYLDTSRGRVALIAATATFRPWNRAGEQRPEIKGRPGVNPLGFKTLYGVEAPALTELRRIGSGLGFDLDKERNRRHIYSDKEIPKNEETGLDFLGSRFVLSDAFSISTEANRKDVEENLRWIREARRQADWVVMSLHCHESGGKSFLKAHSRTELQELADFAVEFAHQAIDAGADLFVGHGSHVPLGIEIYNGKPIFYSVGNFVFQNETVRFLPSEAYDRFDLDFRATPSDFQDARTRGDTKGHPADPLYWENMVAVCDFRERKLTEIRLYPIEEGYGKPRSQRGRPVLADGDVTERIIKRIENLSKLYGTVVRRKNGIGVIQI